MNHTAAVRARPHRAPGLVPAGLALAVVTIIGILGHQSASSPASGPTAGATATGPAALPSGEPPVGSPIPPSSSPPSSSPPSSNPSSIPSSDIVGGDRHAVLGEADGVVPDGTSVFDDGIPAVANLDPGLLKALRRAATDAAKGGVKLQVNSGWRSPRYQQQLLREAVAEYGSEEEAARWVATAETSAHVSGDAVDVGPAKAAAWLSGHGARYGLCPIYRNEPWHYERRPDAVDHGCPALYADPTQDPRMRP